MPLPIAGAEIPRTTWRGLVAIAAGGVLLRLVAVFLTPEWSLSADGWRFIHLRDSGMEGTAFIPPFYPFFLMLVQGVAGSGLTPLRVVQSCLGGMTILLTGVVAYRLAGKECARSASVTATALAAFTPPLLLSDITILSESWAALLLAGFVLFAGTGTATGALSAGGTLGLASLCRPQTLPYGLARSLFIGFFQPRGRGRAVASAGLMLLIVGPWGVRNYLLFDRVVPVSTNGGYNFWKSFHPDGHGTEDQFFDTSIFDRMDEGDFDAYGYSEGLRFILDNPLASAALAPVKLGHFLGLERLFFIGLRDRFWGPIPWPIVILAGLTIPATQVLWLYFGTLGMLRAPVTGVRNEILGLLAFTGVFHLIFNGVSRYHIPLIPLFLAAAATGLARFREPEPVAWRRYLPAAVTLVMVIFWGYEVMSEWAQLRGSLRG